VPDTRRLAVIVAMPSELRHLPGLPHLPGPTSDNTPWPVVSWDYQDLRITAVQCGIGMIRASAATESTITRFRPDAIINFGCTGAHDRDINVGDVVIGTRAVSHASTVIGPDGAARFDLHDGHEPPPAGQTGVASDPELLAIARRSASGWTPDPWIGATADQEAPQVHEGVIASADVWTQAPEAISALASRHGSLCEDMEAAAIATIASLHGVPFITIKDISNNELQRATVFDPSMEHLPETEVGRRAAVLVGRIINRLAKNL